jgi:hypothetical protein
VKRLTKYKNFRFLVILLFDWAVCCYFAARTVALLRTQRAAMSSDTYRMHRRMLFALFLQVLTMLVGYGWDGFNWLFENVVVIREKLQTSINSSGRRHWIVTLINGYKKTIDFTSGKCRRAMRQHDLQF